MRRGLHFRFRGFSFSFLHWCGGSFFLKEEKERTGGRKRGRARPPLRRLFWRGRKNRENGPMSTRSKWQVASVTLLRREQSCAKSSALQCAVQSFESLQLSDIGLGEAGVAGAAVRRQSRMASGSSSKVDRRRPPRAKPAPPVPSACRHSRRGIRAERGRVSAASRPDTVHSAARYGRLACASPPRSWAKTGRDAAGARRERLGAAQASTQPYRPQHCRPSGTMSCGRTRRG